MDTCGCKSDRHSGNGHITVLTLPSTGSHHSRPCSRPSLRDEHTPSPSLSFSHAPVALFSVSLFVFMHLSFYLPSTLLLILTLFVPGLRVSARRSDRLPSMSTLQREKARATVLEGTEDDCYQKISMVFERDFNWGIRYIWKGEVLRVQRKRSADLIHTLRHS